MKHHKYHYTHYVLFVNSFYAKFSKIYKNKSKKPYIEKYMRI